MSLSRRRRLTSLSLAAFGALLISRNASATDRNVVVALDGGSCVTEAALRAAVAARGGLITNDAPVKLRVRVDARRDGRVAVEIGGRGAHVALTERRFVAASCADAADALGLVIALATDEPDTHAEPEAAGQPAATSATAATATPEAVADDARSETTSPRADGEAGARADDPATSPPARFALVAGVLGSSFGEGQVGGRVGAAVEWNRSLLPWIEVSASTNLARRIEGGGGRAEPTWTTGRLAAAPVSAALGHGLRVSALCAFDAGALTVEGSGAARIYSRTRPWFAIAAGVRARWDLGGAWVAGVDVAAVAPLVRDDFVFVNGGSAYRVPVFGAETAISIGAHFP